MGAKEGHRESFAPIERSQIQDAAAIVRHHRDVERVRLGAISKKNVPIIPRQSASFSTVNAVLKTEGRVDIIIVAIRLFSGQESHPPGLILAFDIQKHFAPGANPLSTKDHQDAEETYCKERLDG